MVVSPYLEINSVVSDLRLWDNTKRMCELRGERRLLVEHNNVCPLIPLDVLNGH